MNAAPECASWFATLIAGTADSAARHELKVVRAAVAGGQRHALAHAFASHRKYLVGLMSWTDAQADFFCISRLQQLAAGGIPTDDLFYIQSATALAIQITKGDL